MLLVSLRLSKGCQGWISWQPDSPILSNYCDAAMPYKHHRKRRKYSHVKESSNKISSISCS
jgi:hypothetical protein